MTPMELELETAIKEAGDMLDVRLDVELAKELLTMLREHEPVKPFREGFEDYNCGSCGAGLRYEDDIYCPYCGKEIKWDG